MLKNISRSLSDILGSEYMEAVVTVATEIGGMDKAEAQRLANEKVDFFPESYIKKMDELAEATGKPVEVIEQDTERDNFMTAEEAVEYGLIDRVITKRQ